MTLTGRKALPILRGTIANVGPWQSTYALSNHRVYPYQLGCSVRGNSTDANITTNGEGSFAAGNYILPCAKTFYGSSWLYVPSLSRITRVSSVSGADDLIVISPTVSLLDGEYLLNLGNDTASPSTTVTPNFDASTIVMYSDLVGNTVNSSDYVSTGRLGTFETYLATGTFAVDLLITDSSGTPKIVIPFVQPTQEVI